VSRLRGRLYLLEVGLGGANIALHTRAGHWPPLAREAVAPQEWPQVFLVGGAIVSRLIQAVGDSEKYDGMLNSRNRDAQEEWHQLRADLRRSFVSIALANDITLPEATILARHGDSRTTAAAYADVLESDRHRIGRKLATTGFGR
jgi:hypothetical protein